MLREKAVCAAERTNSRTLEELREGMCVVAWDEEAKICL